jgi:hypothetical protein
MQRKMDIDLDEFERHFEHQWLSDLCFWYEGAARMTPSTNNGLESLNGRIKQQYTMRNKLPLGAFMSIAERMLGDWSVSAEQRPFQTHITPMTALIRKPTNGYKKSIKHKYCS